MQRVGLKICVFQCTRWRMTSRRWRMRWTTWPPTWQRSQHSLPASVILCRTGVIRSPNWPVFIHCWKRFAWSLSFFFFLLVYVFLVNPFLALTTSYDVHGRVFSIQPERFHRVPCLNSDRSCVLRRSQVLESEHLWLDLPVCDTLYERNCISSTKSVARKWSGAGGTHTFDCGIKSERPMLTLMLLFVANLVILWTLYCTVNSMYMLFTGMWEHLV